MRIRQSTRRTAHPLSSALMLAGLLVSASPIGAPSGAQAADRVADTEAARLEKWRERYRALLTRTWRARDDASQLQRTLEQSRQTRHPRGRARFELKQRIEEAQLRVAQLEAELAELLESARRDDVPPGVMTAIEDQVAASRAPAAYEETSVDSDEDEDRDAGRNPLYADEDDDQDESSVEDDEGRHDESYRPRDPDARHDD